MLIKNINTVINKNSGGKEMKKRILSLLLAGIMLFSIVGCAPQKKQNEGTSSPKAETDAEESGKDGITISLWKWIPTDGVQKIYDAIEGKTSFTDPEFVEGMNIWKEMFDKGFFAEGSLGTALYPEINDNMMMGGTDGKKYYIMENCGTWHGSSMTKTTIEGEAANGNCDPDTHLGAFPLPPVKEGCKSNMVATVDIAWGINKNATEEEKKAAFEFVSWMAEGKGHEVFSNTLQVLPAAKDISLEEGIASLNGEDEKEAVKMFQDYVENNSGAREIQYPDVSNALDDALVSVASGIMTPEEALETVQTASAGMSR